MSSRVLESKQAAGRPELSWWDVFSLELMALGTWAVMNFLARSADLRLRGLERFESLCRNGRGLLIAGWHGKSLVPVHFLRGRGVWAMVSLSRDGEYVQRLFTWYGWRTIRGSTSRGSTRALLRAARRLKDGDVLAFTPDGPRGPARQVSPGVLYLASLAGAPIIPVGVSARCCHHLPTWDRYMIPAPFTRVGIVFGEPLWAPRRPEPGEIDTLRDAVRTAIDAAEREAESLARGVAGA